MTTIVEPRECARMSAITCAIASRSWKAGTIARQRGNGARGGAFADGRGLHAAARLPSGAVERTNRRPAW